MGDLYSVLHPSSLWGAAGGVGQEESWCERFAPPSSSALSCLALSHSCASVINILLRLRQQRFPYLSPHGPRCVPFDLSASRLQLAANALFKPLPENESNTRRKSTSIGVLSTAGKAGRLHLIGYLCGLWEGLSVRGSVYVLGETEDERRRWGI